jgi:hypothetical protein
LNTVGSANVLISSHINCSNLDYSFQLLCSQLPRWCQLLAMTAPWSIEFN